MKQSFSIIDHESSCNWQEVGSLEPQNFDVDPLEPIIEPIRHVTQKNLTIRNELQSLWDVEQQPVESVLDPEGSYESKQDAEDLDSSNSGPQSPDDAQDGSDELAAPFRLTEE